jgi:DNA-directed RNA polymerase subunit RPC12/RpoP
MAIEFDCPHCGHHYRLKDDLAGKAAACKNCRKKITIPQPVTVPGDDPPAPVDVEAAAVAALSDAPKAEEDPAQKLIPVECNYCGHKWTEPLSRAGKNTLCPDPECRQRVKIPEPKDELYDWRQTRTKGPSLAKQNNQKLEDVQDAGDAKIVSGQALKEAGAIEEDIEPRPLKQKVMFALLGVGLLGLFAFGILYATRTRTEGKEDRLMAEAQKEFADAAEALPKEEAATFAAVMHLAGGEHALRHDRPEKLKEAMEQYGKAQSALRTSASAARGAVVAELAVAVIDLGGTERQARDQLRIRWTPGLDLKTRPNEHLFTVHEELRKMFGLAQGTPMDFRTYLARRLTRELARRGQAGLAVELLPLALFTAPEQAEGKAVVALEIYRADKGSKYPAEVAKELAARGADLAKASPRPASAQTLFAVLKTEKAPNLGLSPPGGGAVTDDVRFAYAGLAILEGRPDEALALAQRPGRAEDRMRALALCADWMADPAPALDAARPVAALGKDGKGVKFPPYATLRLAQVAAAAGRHDQVDDFVQALPDEALKAWATGDAVRLRLAAAPATKGEDAWAALPDDPKKFRAGHAWGRLWLARHNTRLTGDRAGQVKAVGAWPSPISAFGKAGVALGLQDREK